MRTTIAFKLDQDDPFLKNLRKDINLIPFSYDYPRTSQPIVFHQAIFNATFEALRLELLHSQRFASIDKQRELLKTQNSGKEIYTFITNDYSYFGELLKEQIDIAFNRELSTFYLNNFVKTIEKSIEKYGQEQLKKNQNYNTDSHLPENNTFSNLMNKKLKK